MCVSRKKNQFQIKDLDLGLIQRRRPNVRRTIALFALLFAFTGISRSQSGQDSASPKLKWISIPDAQIEIDGLPWYAESGDHLSRLPIRLKDSYRKEVWDLAQSPSGGRIRFRTNSTVLAIRLKYPGPPDMANMHAFGQTGVDLYIDGIYRDTAVAGRDTKLGLPEEHVFYENEPMVVRDITLYLPLYSPVKVVGIGINAEAEPQAAKPFAISKPIVFYGTSITQGASASRPGMSYEGILGRLLNVDFVNLGFSGNGKGEPAVARTVADIDAACFVLDFAQNNATVESLKTVYGPFVEIIRSKHPDTPILVMTPIYSSHESWSRDADLDGMRSVIRQVAGHRIANGDRNLEIVEGTDLIGPSRGDGLVDGVHPNDLGFQWMAEGLANRIAKVLGLR
jgi:lysophospholipase L1-like esterase